MAILAAVGEREARRIAEAAGRAVQHFGDQGQRAHRALADAGNQQQFGEIARPRLGRRGGVPCEAARTTSFGRTS